MAVVVASKVKAPTQKEMYEAIIKMAQGEDIKMSKDDIVAFAEKKMEQLARKASSGGDKKNEEHEEFIDIIRDILSESESGKMKCGDILRDERAANFEWKDGKATSSQRVSAILKKMVDKGDVAKVTEKKDTLFYLV